MAFQGEREQGGLEIEMREEIVESMAQDEIPEQEMLIGQDELPQPNSEPEMGAAAEAAVDDAPLPSSVKFLPQSPADPRLRAKRLPQAHLTWARYT